MDNEKLSPEQIIDMLQDNGIICLERFSYLTPDQKKSVIEFVKQLSGK